MNAHLRRRKSATVACTQSTPWQFPGCCSAGLHSAVTYCVTMSGYVLVANNQISQFINCDTNPAPFVYRVHLGRSYTQNAFKSMGCNACCTSDSTLQAHTSCHPLHARRSKGRDAEAWQSSAKEHHQCVFYKWHTWECWSSQLCYGECHFTTMMMRLRCVDGPVFGMAVVALDSPACMLC